MPEFKHSMGEETIKKLKAEKLFTDKLRPDVEKGDVFFAIRYKYGSFYLKGHSLFKYANNGFSTHYKFAFLPSNTQKTKTYVTETDLNSMKVIENFKDGYDRIKQSTALYANPEATGVSALYAFAPRTQNESERYFLVDIEVSFESLTVPGTTDRIDILLYDNQDQRLLFCEAKHFSNPEIWPTENNELEVIEQLNRYNEQIAKRNIQILDAYEIAFKEYNQLMDTKLYPPKTICGQCGLLVFGFDRHGLGVLDASLKPLLNGHKHKFIGSTNSIGIKNLFTTLS